MTRQKIRYGLALLASRLSSYESITLRIFVIVVNGRTGTPSNPSKALKIVGVSVGPILADTDDAVVVVVVVVAVEGRRWKELTSPCEPST